MSWPALGSSPGTLSRAVRVAVARLEAPVNAIRCYDRAVVPVGKAQALKALPTGDAERLRTRYDTILTEADAGNPPRPHRPGTRGRVKQSPACNLIRRLRKHRNEVLALPHRPARSLRQQSGRTRPAKAQTQAESLRLFPLRYRRRCLCHHPLLPFDPPQTVRRSFQLVRPDVPREIPNAPIGIAE